MRINYTWTLLVYALAVHAADSAGILRRHIAPIFPLRPNVAPLSRGAIALAVTRELALSGPRVFEDKSRIKHRQIASQNTDLDAAIAFYAKQHDRILRELLLPALKDVSTKGTEIPNSQPMPKELEWDIAVSTEAEPLQCAVLADVPPGTVLVRPRTDQDDATPSDYVSIEALNGLLRLQPSNLTTLFPNATVSDVEKLYAHASLAVRLHVKSHDYSDDVSGVSELQLEAQADCYRVAGHRRSGGSAARRVRYRACTAEGETGVAAERVRSVEQAVPHACATDAHDG
ncbi:signal peptide-containing protein, putative [Babesia ovata]|uniref:Signal peptide-containing protein, putative n=1 Tax=Babesia ovata TaxID=189622 RepID=A0A2H6KF82_9APIC|nr:signal peptide-containing protein, putative [Babesia ovata]GBE61661.1 signal peptide-containing protein, putative [Babesia ovata]